MNILLINSIFESALHERGHTILSLRLTSGLHKLQPMLAEHKFEPDLILQQEALGERVFLADLPQFSCIKIFWAIDSHLNMYWQKYYARLFDRVLSPHVSLFSALPDAFKLATPCFRMPWPGVHRSFTPYAKRKDFINFVGRIDNQRPMRASLQHIMQQHFATRFVQDIPYETMLDLYESTQLVPNESIAGEVNFRLMEGASCGCCVLSPDIGEDQNTLFEPGKEFIPYSDGLELLELLKFFQKKIHLAEKIGFAAWQRVQQEHLPPYKTQQIEELAESSHVAQVGSEAACELWLAIMQTQRNEFNLEQMHYTLGQLQKLEQSDLILSKCLLLSAEIADWNLVHILSEKILANKGTDWNIEAEIALFGAGLLQNDLSLVNASLQRMHSLHDGSPCKTADHLSEACLLAARILFANGMDCELGFLFQAGKHCPTNGLEMLTNALYYGAEERACATLMVNSKKIRHHLPHTFLGACAIESLRNPTWLSHAQLGLAYLRTYRIDDGLHELQSAKRLAHQQAKETELLSLLHNQRADHVVRAIQR